MTTLEIILLCIIGVLAIFCLCIFISNNIKKKEIERLINSINAYIDHGELTHFSVKDNQLAELQNSVFDLESLINLEKSNTLNQTKKNTEFISDVSHQLKTPLAGLRLYCEMDNSENPSEHTEKELLLIEKMENLIQKLLRLEKIKSSAYVMDFQPCDLNLLAKEIVTSFNPLFPEKNYNISGEAVVRCDKAWLSEAISNIVKNASEHTQADGAISISIDGTDKSTTIEISDNGGGIDEDGLKNLFVRFYRSENALPSSAGIGMAITKAIVERHHGIITAENKNGGLSITMCIPNIDGYVTI